MPARFRVLPSNEDVPARGGAVAAGPLVEREVEITHAGDEIRVGRRSDVELPLPFPALSAVHARLIRKEASWFVEDAGSTNGTWLGGERLASGARRPLEPGAELRLGNVRLRFDGEGPPRGSRDGVPEGTGTIARRLVDDLFADAALGAPTVRVERGASPRRLPLTRVGHPYVVGRAETCALPLGVEEVSREHAAFVRDAEGVVVRDLGSKNGVVVAGRRIESQRRLSDGDVVEIGPVALALEDPVDRYLRQLEEAPVATVVAPAVATVVAPVVATVVAPAVASVVAPVVAPVVARAEAEPPAAPVPTSAPSRPASRGLTSAGFAAAVGAVVLLLLALVVAVALLLPSPS
jgi:pSer/pThr/pTyr-binding forkhead associated (FHA) protein